MAKRVLVTVNGESLIRKMTSIEQGLNAGFAERMGNEILIKMKDMIAKGLSPIEGKGRFPAYKAQAERQSILKPGASLSKAGKKQNRKQARQVAKKGYPESVKDKFPNKKNRPVNLYLSGEFLNNLDNWVISLGDKFAVKLGFRDKLSVLKEHGHRYEANGQPSRPIIPTGNEKLAKRLLLVVQDMMRKQIDRTLKRK